MNIGKQNIGRIQKGLKNNDISKENIVIEQSAQGATETAASISTKVYLKLESI